MKKYIETPLIYNYSDISHKTIKGLVEMGLIIEEYQEKIEL